MLERPVAVLKYAAISVLTGGRRTGPAVLV
jgi:hypothetical protein